MIWQKIYQLKNQVQPPDEEVPLQLAVGEGDRPHSDHAGRFQSQIRPLVTRHTLAARLNAESMSGQPRSTKFRFVARLAGFVFIWISGDRSHRHAHQNRFVLDERQQASRDLACLAAQACEDLKGKATVVLNMTASHRLSNFFVVTTARWPGKCEPSLKKSSN